MISFFRYCATEVFNDNIDRKLDGGSLCDSPEAGEDASGCS